MFDKYKLFDKINKKGNFMDCNCQKKIDKNIVEALQDEMNKNGFVSDQAVKNIAKNLGKFESDVYGVLTFYAQFKRQPSAKYTIEVCTGTACYILGAQMLVDVLKKKLGVELFQASSDNKYFLATVRCLGCCGEAPVLKINDKVYNKVTPQMLDEILKNLD